MSTSPIAENSSSLIIFSSMCITVQPLKHSFKLTYSSAQESHQILSDSIYKKAKKNRVTCCDAHLPCSRKFATGISIGQLRVLPPHLHAAREALILPTVAATLNGNSGPAVFSDGHWRSVERLFAVESAQNNVSQGCGQRFSIHQGWRNK